MEMYKPNPERLKDFWSTLQDVWFKLYGSPFPTCAAINGHSPAGWWSGKTNLYELCTFLAF